MHKSENLYRKDDKMLCKNCNAEIENYSKRNLSYIKYTKLSAIVTSYHCGQPEKQELETKDAGVFCDNTCLVEYLLNNSRKDDN